MNRNREWLRYVLRCFLATSAVSGLVPLTGCGDSSIGRVSGVVQLDNQPLSDATVEFQPDAGSPSYGITDDKGRYELTYLPGTLGAEIGKHTVRITTYDWITKPDGSKVEIPERVPANYNVDSELYREVEAGGQTINFDLQSGN